MTSLDLLRVLLDADRLAVAGALAARHMTIDEVVLASGRDRRAVLANERVNRREIVVLRNQRIGSHRRRDARARRNSQGQGP